MPKSPYMGVTNTFDYKCHNRGIITELILHKHTCINRKVGVLDPPTSHGTREVTPTPGDAPDALI